MKVQLWGLQLSAREKREIAGALNVTKRTVERWTTTAQQRREATSEDAERVSAYLNASPQFSWVGGPPPREQAKPIIVAFPARQEALMVAAGGVVAAMEGPDGNYPERFGCFTEAVEVRVTYVPFGRGSRRMAGHWLLVAIRAKINGSPDDYDPSNLAHDGVDMARFRDDVDQIIDAYARPEAAEFWRKGRYRAH
jgi:hypothetical protein